MTGTGLGTRQGGRTARGNEVSVCCSDCKGIKLDELEGEEEEVGLPSQHIDLQITVQVSQDLWDPQEYECVHLTVSRATI